MQKIAKFRCECGEEEWVVYERDGMLEAFAGRPRTKCSCGGQFSLMSGTKVEDGLIVIWGEFELEESGVVEFGMERILKRGEQFPQPTFFFYCSGCKRTVFVPKGAEVTVCCGFLMEGPIRIGEGAISTWQEQELG